MISMYPKLDTANMDDSIPTATSPCAGPWVQSGSPTVMSWMKLAYKSHWLQFYIVFNLAVCQNLVPLVNIKIAGKWMFIPLKMVLIGIDPYPDVEKPWFPVRKKVPIHLGSPNSCAKSSCSASKLRASGGNPVKFCWRCFLQKKTDQWKAAYWENHYV